MNICDQCETVSHCSKFGCIPIEGEVMNDKHKHGYASDLYHKLDYLKRAECEPSEVKDAKAIESACRFIEKNIAPRKCDSDAVSNCWRCKSVYLASRMREILATKQAAPKAEQAVMFTPAMFKAAAPWIEGWQHMNRATRESNFEEAYKAARDAQGKEGDA